MIKIDKKVNNPVPSLDNNIEIVLDLTLTKLEKTQFSKGFSKISKEIRLMLQNGRETDNEHPEKG